jgi:4-amino-4-deoxy-L-arabinose transferase-like glycosyltransferase
MKPACGRARWGVVQVAQFVLIVLFGWQAWNCMRSCAQTFDEAEYICSGYACWSQRAFAFNAETPVLPKLLVSLPVYVRWPHLRVPLDLTQPSLQVEFTVGSDFLYGSGVDATEMLTTARLANLVLAVSLLVLVARWAGRLWGPAGSLLALGVATFEPNLIAHGSLATTDMCLTLFGTGSLYFLWEHIESPRVATLLGCGLCAGAAVASKHTGLVFLGIDALVVVLLVAMGRRFTVPFGDGWSGGAAAVGGGAERGRGGRWFEASGGFAVVVAIALVVLDVCYFGRWIGCYFDGLRTQMAHQQQGHVAFFMGQTGTAGWWNYFLVAFAVKSTLGFLALVGASVVWPGDSRPGGDVCASGGRTFEDVRSPEAHMHEGRTRTAAVCLLLPVFCLFAFTTRLKVDLGVRYILIVYPLLFVWLARLALPASRVALTLVGLLVAAHIASSLSVAPHMLAYYNEAAGGPKGGPRYVADSNVDWGQDLLGLHQWMADNGVRILYLSYCGTASPVYYDVPFQALPGVYQMSVPMSLPPVTKPSVPHHGPRPRVYLAISLTNLYETQVDGTLLYGWLREKEPVTRIGWSIYVYDLSGDAEAHVHLARVYLAVGSAAMAGWEVEQALRLAPDLPDALRLHSYTPLLDVRPGSQKTEP